MKLLIGPFHDADEQASVAREVASQLSGHLTPIQEWHFDFQKHHIGVLVRSHFQRGAAIVGPPDDMSPAMGQLGNAVRDIPLVIDN
jgi:hypothetical protein